MCGAPHPFYVFDIVGKIEGKLFYIDNALSWLTIGIFPEFPSLLNSFCMCCFPLLTSIDHVYHVSCANK